MHRVRSLNSRMVRTGAVIAVASLTTTLWSGCSGKKNTEIVAGVSSQVQVPRDFRSVRLDVNGAFGNVFCHTYPVYDGTVLLPRTLGTLPATDPNLPVTITVTGFTQDAQSGDVAAFNDCSAIPAVGVASRPLNAGGGGRVLRRARQPYVPGRALYLPMPLHYSCYDVDCIQDKSPACSNGDCTCKGGVCTAPDITPAEIAKEVDYSDDLVYGNTNTCFRPYTHNAKDANGNDVMDATGKTTVLPGCMDLALPPQLVDAKSCTYALPGSPSAFGLAPYDSGIPGVVAPEAGIGPDGGAVAASGPGLNVRVVYDNIVGEVLDSEGQCPADGSGAKEGYCLPDPTKPQMFQLAPGLCSPTAVHKITLTQASGQCPAKTQLQPICADALQGPMPTLIDGGTSSDGTCNVSTTLTPAPSALYVLMDKSTGMRRYFGDKVFTGVLSIPLQDPVFSKTQLAFKYLPAVPAECSLPTPFAQPQVAAGDVPFESSLVAQGDIARSIGSVDSDAGASFAPGAGPWYLEAALSAGGAYQALASLRDASKESFNRLAVMVLTDRDFNVGAAADCPAHPDAIQGATTAFAKQGIYTYVVGLKNADLNPGDPPVSVANLAALATAGHTTLFNATTSTDGSVQADALNTVVADLSACLYETPAGIRSAATLTFPDPVAQALVNATYSTTPALCADDTATAPRWIFDQGRIRLCPTTCDRLRTAIRVEALSSEAANVTNNTTVPPTGIVISANEPCGASVVDPPVSDAGFDADSRIVSGDAGLTDGGGVADAGVDATGVVVPVVGDAAPQVP